MTMLRAGWWFTGLDAITANWADISLASPTVSAINLNQTVTWTVGGGRTLQVTHTIIGALEYRVNSGSYISCPSGTNISVSSGNTVNFRFTPTVNETKTVTVTDTTRGGVVDTFLVESTGY